MPPLVTSHVCPFHFNRLLAAPLAAEPAMPFPASVADNHKQSAATKHPAILVPLTRSTLVSPKLSHSCLGAAYSRRFPLAPQHCMLSPSAVQYFLGLDLKTEYPTWMRSCSPPSPSERELRTLLVRDATLCWLPFAWVWVKRSAGAAEQWRSCSCFSISITCASSPSA